jgi:signal transduction histidine kinase
VKRRILAAIVAVSAIALIILGIPLGIAVERLYRNQEIVRLEREAAQATRSIDLAVVAAGDPIELPKGGSRTLQLAFYGPSGTRLAGRGPFRADAVVRTALRGAVSDAHSAESLTVSVPISHSEVVVGAIRAAAPASVVSTRVHRAWIVMAGIGLCAVAAAAVLGLWLARRLTVPLEALVHDARRLGDGDFATRSQRSGVPELDDLAGALDSTATRLGEALERERRFSSDASHQLRTPIAALRLQLESAQLDPDADADAAIGAALRELDRLERTVEELLALARDQHRDAGPLALRAVLDDVETDWRGRLAATGRPIVVRADQGLPLVHASRSATRQILDVLVDNAARHGAGQVLVRARRTPRGVVVEVTDEGPGITGSTTVIWARGVGDGHGIGLALARSLAETDGGRLVLERAAPHPVFALVFPGTGADASVESETS